MSENKKVVGEKKPVAVEEVKEPTLKEELIAKNAELEKREGEIANALVQIAQQNEALIMERSMNAAVHASNTEIIKKL